MSLRSHALQGSAFYLAIGGCFTLLLAYSAALFLRFWPPLADEVAFGTTAKAFADQLRLSTPVYSGLLPGIDQHMYYLPPLYFLILGAVFKVFGFGLLQGRLLALVFALAVLGLSILLALEVSGDRRVALAAALLIASDTYIQRDSHLIRMDLLTIALSLAAALLYLRWLRQRGSRGLVVAGVLAGLAVMTHPYGLLIVVSMVAHFLWREARYQGVRVLFTLIAPSVIFAVLWVLVYGLQDGSSFADQFGGQLFRKSGGGLVGIRLVAREAGPLLSVYIIYGLTALWGALQALGGAESRRAFLAIASVVTLVAGVVGHETGYYAFFVPWCAILLATLTLERVATIRDFQDSWRLQLLGVVTAANLLAGAYWFYQYDLQARLGTSYGAVVAQLAPYVPARSHVFLYVATSADPYFYLQDHDPGLTFTEAVLGLPAPATAIARQLQGSNVLITDHGSRPVAFLPRSWRLIATVGRACHHCYRYDVLTRVRDVALLSL